MPFWPCPGVGPRGTAFSVLRLGEELAQPAEAGEHAALDGSERDAEALGELRLRQAAVVGELEGLSLLAGELGQRRLHRGAPVSQHRVLVGRTGGWLGSDLQRPAP